MDSGGGSNEDDLTMKMKEILGVNNALRTAVDKGAQVKIVVEDWNQLQLQVAQYLNGDMPGLPKQIGQKPIRGLCQRLKGKSGRFRGNLSGKRVDFSARTVISPDPNLRIDQVGVPQQVAKTMTYPDRVSRYNIEALRRLVRNGPNVHPGANYVRDAAGVVRSLAYGNRVEAAAKLAIGDIVERHMIDGDVVLFNRQPSLHKLSIMSHRAKVMPWRTFRFNECVCKPYNADFDGDEMNLHLPQTEEARAEAALLMATPRNIVTPGNGEPQVAATQDFLTCSYLITQKDVFFTRESFCNLVSTLGDGDEQIELPPPAIFKPTKLWTGKQVMGLLVRPNKQSSVLVNLECAEKNYSKKGGPMCAKDGFVVFRNSEHLSGNMAKKTLGDGSKTGLVYVLLKDHGIESASRLLNRTAKLCANYLHSRGFSIGIEDVTPSQKLTAAKNALLKIARDKADQEIEAFKHGRMALKPGCDATQSLEGELTKLLADVRADSGKMAMGELLWSNAPRIMADCGSKGSEVNIAQMIALLGQQQVDGKRIQDDFVSRTLPHFEVKSLFPAAKGFVANSFYTGLTATEFFFHTMGGREGLVDTAVKTATTGYMARRLMKAMEDLAMQYDGSVRNSEGVVVQFVYGRDGLDPSAMEGKDRPIDLDRMYKHIRATQSAQRRRRADNHGDQQLIDDPAALTKVDVLSGEELRLRVDEALGSEEWKKHTSNGETFLGEVRSFLGGIADGVEAVGAAGGGTVSSAHQFACGGLSEPMLFDFLTQALTKYRRSHVEAGEAIGTLGAQSISEPSTQMTLKTFHFAGVASMNVTLGVPRLTEIINATRNISTPIITAHLVQSDDEVAARMVKARVEKTTLGQVCKRISEVYSPDSVHCEVTLDTDAIEKLQLNIDTETVKRSILKGVAGYTRPAILRHLQEHNVTFSSTRRNKLRIRPPDKSKTERGTYFAMQALKAALPDVIVQGIASVSRAVITKDAERAKKGVTQFNLYVEGLGLAEVMGSPGVMGSRTVTNNILEVLSVLGIEAARAKISGEIAYIMDQYGIAIDIRHLMLLSDVMTFKGEVLGITRFGVAKMRESVLMLASFEKTTDHLFDAAVHSRKDKIVGVSESIIMGVPVPLGTGPFKLLRDADRDHCRTNGGGTAVGEQLKKQARSIFTL
jgi:DNA-directed RNA polymerase III subunit RPC1